jgi:hypothetical protein
MVQAGFKWMITLLCVLKMKYLIFLLILLLPFVVANNDSFEENISLGNESLENVSFEFAVNDTAENNLTNFTEVFEAVNGSNESIIEEVFNISNESLEELVGSNFSTTMNETNEILAFKILDFFISSFVEGGIYSLDWFEFILSSAHFSGQEYSGDFLVDLTDTPNVEAAGELYSASVGDFGLLAIPVAEISLYCGDGTCNNGETCSTCSGDCGACVVRSSGGGRNVETCDSGYELVEGQCIIIENKTVENKTVEEKELVVYDIVMSLEQTIIENGRDLRAVLDFKLVGNNTFSGNFSFDVLDDNGTNFYSEMMVLEFNESRVFRKVFENIDLEEGLYELVLTVNSSLGVDNQYRVSFEVKSQQVLETVGITGRIIGGVLDNAGYVVLIIVAVLVISFVLFKIRKRPLHKKKRIPNVLNRWKFKRMNRVRYKRGLKYHRKRALSLLKRMGYKYD